MNATCPRCNGSMHERMAVAADASWEVYLCGQCFYTWRSSEPAMFVSHERYDARFRLTPEQIARFPAFPPVPRRRA